MKKEYNIDEIINTLDFESNHFITTAHNLYLTQKEISILKSFNIDYDHCSTAKELIRRIEDMLDEEESEELEQVSIAIAERDYYQNTNK